MIKINFIPGFPDFKRLRFGINNNFFTKVLSSRRNPLRGNGGDHRKHQAIPPLNMRRK